MLKNKIGLSAAALTLGVAASNLLGTVFSFADETAAPAASAEAAAATAGSPTADPGTATPTGCNQTSIILICVYVVILVAMFYFLIIRPQRKRKKEEAEMKNSMTLGQKVVTIGGIVGTIVNIKDDNITIQTSIDNSFIEVKNWAIREVEKIETAGKDDKAADEKK